MYGALLAGYASHFVADALNKAGVPLLWPLGGRFRLLPGGGVRSGGVAEFAAASGAFALAAVCVYELYPSVFGRLIP